MQKQQEKLEILPRRNSQQRTKFKNGHDMNFFTNLYEVEINQKNNTMYQFFLETTPQIPADSAHLYRLIYKRIYRQLKEKLQDIIESGAMLWGFKNLPKPTMFQAQFDEADHHYKFDVLVKPVKAIQFWQFFKDPVKKKMILQISNSKVKGTLRSHMNFVELGQGKFFNPTPEKVPNLDLHIRRGFKMTLCPIGNELLMQIDVCSKISRSDNFLKELTGQNHQTANSRFKDATVITRYGKIRTYRIQSIDYDKNPLSKFYSDREAGQISFLEYYQKSYGVKVTNTKQPLIYTVRNYERKMVDGKITQKAIYVYLIPQLVSLTGMSQTDKSNHKSMQQIAPYTKLEPKQRAQETEATLIQNFNKDKNNNLLKIKQPKVVKGAVLNNQYIKLGNGTSQTKDGTFNFKNKVLSPANFKDWVMVYSLSNRPEHDNSDADKAVNFLQQCSEAFGIVVKDPGFITIKGRSVEDWKNQIAKDVKENGKPQIIVLFFQKFQERFYGQLKRFLTIQLKIPSQAIRRRTLSNPQHARNMSAASKILLQMNAKLGMPLWQISDNPFGEKKVMYGGLSISKGANGFTLAFVGTIDKNCTRVYSEAIVGIKKKEQIPQTTFDSIFKNWAKTYYKTTKTVPDLIIIYREGLAEAQIQKYVKRQILSLQKTVETIATKVKVPNYNPQLLFIGVNKKISMRFYNMVGKQQGAKFIPNLRNPDSGSVVVEQLSVGNLADFHLAAQKVTQGTCTPTQYITIFKNFDLNMQQLIEFTYGQCFNYYNWTGAVRVPACLQCADKLAKLVGQSIKDNLTGLGEIQNTYHFL